MAAATIPAPREDDIKIARIAVTSTATLNGLDLDDPGVAEFIERTVAVQAQMSAEIRWLRNIVHTCTKG